MTALLHTTLYACESCGTLRAFKPAALPVPYRYEICFACMASDLYYRIPEERVSRFLAIVVDFDEKCFRMVVP